MTTADLDSLPVAGPFPRTWRAVPSRYPPIHAFESVTNADDLEAVLELEGWTNDRLVDYRLRRLPEHEWVFGRANASVVMAAFLHASPSGARFSDSGLGAWYASLAEITALKEVAHHLRREAVNAGMDEIVSQYRGYRASITGECVDIRGMRAELAGLYSGDDYSTGQAFGALVRNSDRTGIVFDSLRDPDGVNLAIFRPTAVGNVTQSSHYELTVPASGRIIVRRL